VGNGYGRWWTDHRSLLSPAGRAAVIHRPTTMGRPANTAASFFHQFFIAGPALLLGVWDVLVRTCLVHGWSYHCMRGKRGRAGACAATTLSPSFTRVRTVPFARLAGPGFKRNATQAHWSNRTVQGSTDWDWWWSTVTERRRSGSVRMGRRPTPICITPMKY